MDYLITAVLSVFGFVALYFVGKPIVEFLKIRAKIVKSMIFFAKADNVMLGPDSALSIEARKVYREHASDLIASSTLITLHSVWAKLGLLPSMQDIDEAKRNLIGLSNGVGVQGEQLNNSKRVDNIRKALRIRNKS